MSAGHQLLTQLLNCVVTFVAHATASLFILLVPGSFWVKRAQLAAFLSTRLPTGSNLAREISGKFQPLVSICSREGVIYFDEK